MSARLEFAFLSSPTEARFSNLQTVRQIKPPFHMTDSTNKNSEPKQETHVVKLGLAPAPEPYTCL